MEKLVIPKPMPLVIWEIGVGVEVTLIDIVTHTSKVFKTPDIILKNKHVVEKLKSQPINLVKLVDDLVVGVK